MKKLLLVGILCFGLMGCASTGSINQTKACEKAKVILDVASAEVKRLKDAGIMSGDDYEKAVLAEFLARDAMILICP